MTGDIWTIQRLLTWTREYLHKNGSPTARLDSELLLSDTLQLRRLDLHLKFDQPVQSDELAKFKLLIKRRAKLEPVAYILGKRAFYGIELRVNPHVLVPRPETETLVDVVLAFLKSDSAPAGEVLDLCTGSGAIALALADELRKLGKSRKIIGTDVSQSALTLAQQNAVELQSQQEVTFVHGDLWQPLAPNQKFAVIASNPPYVLHDVIATLDADVRDHEPHLALDGGVDGMDVLRRIALRAHEFLLPSGLLAVELGSKLQGAAFGELLTRAGLLDAKCQAIQGGPTSIVTARAAATQLGGENE